MATNFSPVLGVLCLNQFPSIVMFGVKGFYVSASGVIQGHHDPLVILFQGMCHKLHAHDDLRSYPFAI